MTDLKDKLTDAAKSLGEGASGVAADLQSRAKDAWDTVQHRSKRAVRESGAYIRKRPGPTALVACGIGLVAGLLLKRRAPLSFKDRYIVNPLRQSRGLLLGVLIACGTMFRHTLFQASIPAKEIGGNAGGDGKDSIKPVKKTTRKTAR